MSERPTARALVLIAVVTAGATSCGDGGEERAGSAVPPKRADLTGSAFTSTGVAGQTLVDGTQISLRFEGDTVSANAGCNTMTGGYELDGATLVVGELAQTMMSCDEGRQRQDEWLAALLSGRPALSLADDVLTVTSGSTTVDLVVGPAETDASAPPTT